MSEKRGLAKGRCPRERGGPAVIRVSLAVWDDAVVFTLYFSNVADVDISFDDTFPDWP